MKNLISLLAAVFLLLSFTACGYHPRSKVPRPGPRPSYKNRPPEDFVIQQRPLEVVEAPPVLIKRPLIVIDAGHGGDDFGTRSASKPKYHEKSLNLTTAITLNDFMRKLGYETVLTRSKDEFIALQKRADFANDREADLFVSVHYNSAPAKQAEGIEIFYYKSDENKARTSESKKLANAILDKVIKTTGAKSRGVKQENFAVIRETKMPAVLIEGGFLTNVDEMEKIKDPAYVKSLAWGIAQGIQAYLKDKSSN
jgi:N-acetylmuramoyl-L-alanine amidase